jgi:hypothetical protein
MAETSNTNSNNEVQDKVRVGVVCVTYRDPDKPSLARLYGPLHLIEEMQNQKGSYNITVTLVDSSPTPHPFFYAVGQERLIENNVLYMHVPDRNISRQWLDVQFPDSAHFIPTDDELKNQYWQQQKSSMKAWEAFLPFEESFREIYTGLPVGEFMNLSRPPIGMKKNLGIAATAEKFGRFENIVFADDDDHHADGYVDAVVSTLKTADFARMTQWMTYDYGMGKKDTWGKFNIPFQTDANGTWSVPEEVKNTVLLSSLGMTAAGSYLRKVKEKYSPLLCLAFPPLGHDGALHNYRFDAWQRAVDTFGGCAPTSFCEDMLFYTQNVKTFNGAFNVQTVDSGEPQFLRCSDGTNASIVEWTEQLDTTEVPTWAQKISIIRQNVLSIKGVSTHDNFCRDIAEMFKATGRISWPHQFTSIPNPKESLINA